MIVPAAVFAGVSQLGLQQRCRLSWLLLAVGALSMALGFLQVLQGPESSLRFYDITNPAEAVGLFANRNHFAAHLYVTLVLAAAWLQITAERTFQREEPGMPSTLLFAGAAIFLVAVVGGLALARSRAGIFLTMAALGGIAITGIGGMSGTAQQSRRKRTRSKRVTLAVLAFAVIFTAQFGLGGIVARFQQSPVNDIRASLVTATLDTALKSLPLGTGLGSFVPVYAAAEKRQDIFEGYANRAHNDFAEIFLETGMAGVIFLLAFLGWFAWRSYVVWGTRTSGVSSPEPMLERAATLIIVLLLAHSLVDYPLRTTALSTAFAFMCALLTTAAPAPAEKNPRRSISSEASPWPSAPPAAPGEKWGAGIHWPEDWQNRQPYGKDLA